MTTWSLFRRHNSTPITLSQPLKRSKYSTDSESAATIDIGGHEHILNVKHYMPTKVTCKWKQDYKNTVIWAKNQPTFAVILISSKLAIILVNWKLDGLQENIFHGQALGLWPLKMDKPLFFQTRQKNPFSKSPHIKVLLVNKLRLGESVII